MASCVLDFNAQRGAKEILVMLPFTFQLPM